jgi:uncharacterized coiled-coil protein SlyX
MTTDVSKLRWLEDRDPWPELMAEARGRVVDQLAAAIAWRKVEAAREAVGAALAEHRDAFEQADAELGALTEKAAAAEKAAYAAISASNYARDSERLAILPLENITAKAEKAAGKHARVAIDARNEARQRHARAARELAWLEPLYQKLAASREPQTDLLELLQRPPAPEPKRARRG